MALQHFLAFEVAPVGNNSQFLDACSRTRLPSHVRQLSAVVAYVGDLVRHDQMMRIIDRRLNVVANHSRSPTAGSH